MKTILLVCSAGMSTSLLVTKMEAAAKDAGVECKIFALPFSDAPRVLEEVDCILPVSYTHLLILCIYLINNFFLIRWQDI